METPTPIYAAHCFTNVIEELCRVLTKHGRERFITGPLLVLIWNRLTRMARRFASLTERYCAGTLAGPAPARVREGSARPARGRPEEELPRHFRWLVNMIPESERVAGDVCWLLQRPEMEEMLSMVPEARRTLRPLCRMLGIEFPSLLRRPVRPVVTVEISEPEPASCEAADNTDGPQPQEPGSPVEFSAEWWKLHPPPKPE